MQSGSLSKVIFFLGRKILEEIMMNSKKNHNFTTTRKTTTIF